ncbi:MAG: T9SS type A sorting domain-containing protein [Bacteroidota bacterium]|nr:T9SS type A sorting domain-containing protein [Bacteroidota bacterium]
MKAIILILLVCVLTINGNIYTQDTRQWVAHAAGTSNNSNSGAAGIVEKSGFIYVTGWVTNKGTGSDFVTIKYKPDGEKIWEVYYNYSAKSADKAKAIAVDTAKNVYVTGSSNGGASGLDYATVKYDSNGIEKWVVRYNGPGNGEDQPSALAVNDSMNVYVTGWSKGSGTDFDFATLKYNSSGDLIWEKRYNNSNMNGVDSALGMVLNRYTDLFVTGTSVDSGYDYFTIKYNPATGDSVWGVRYNGSGLGNDIARAIVRNTSTNDIFITGSSQNASGDYDYLTIGLTSNGGVKWISRHDGIANRDDHAYSLALHSNSRVYVTGKSIQTGTFTDIVTIRYDQGSGDSNWVRGYNGPAYDEDIGFAMIGGGNPYIIGSSVGSGVGRDFVLLEYNGTNGKLSMAVRYNGIANSDDVPSGLLSSSGAVYVTGTSKKLKGSEILTIKYVDSDKIRYRTFTQDSLAIKAVGIKTTLKPNGGNIAEEVMKLAYPKIKKGYAGYPGGLVVGNKRPDSAAVYGWMRFEKGKAVTAYLPDAGVPRGFDIYGDKVFAGEKKNPKKEKHDNKLAAELIALKINIGASDAEITPPTFGDVRYDDGNLLNPYRNKTLRQIAAVADNYMTYWWKYPSVDWQQLDTVLTRLNNAFVDSIKIVCKQPLVVTGVEPFDSIWYLKEAIAPLVEPLAFEPGSIDIIPERFEMHQNYPNPFNPTTTITFDLPEPSVVTLTIYDILGREIGKLLDNAEMDEGSQEIIFDASSIASGISSKGGYASGVYFYRIVVNEGQYHQLKKMILLR